MELNHAQIAAQKSRQAHDEWLIALRETTTLADKASARDRGNSLWTEAEKHLRMHGMHQGTDAVDISDLGSLASLNTDLLDETPIDFGPLERAHAASHAMHIFNRVALAVLLVSLGYFAGLVAATDTQHYSTTEVNQRIDRLENLTKGAK